MCGKHLKQIPTKWGDPERDELPGRAFAQRPVLLLALQRAEISREVDDHTGDGSVAQRTGEG